MCPACRQPVALCACGKAQAPPSDGIVRVSRQTQGRGGKEVTLLRGFGLVDAELAPLAKRLKAACGTGGTAKDGAIELQGDHRERVIAWLQQQGWTVKRAGG